MYLRREEGLGDGVPAPCSIKAKPHYHLPTEYKPVPSSVVGLLLPMDNLSMLIRNANNTKLPKHSSIVEEFGKAAKEGNKNWSRSSGNANSS